MNPPEKRTKKPQQTDLLWFFVMDGQEGSFS